MIGLLVNPSDLMAAAEFFELFKTPWEPAVAGRKYRAILCTDGAYAEYDTDVILVYNSREQAADREAGVSVHTANGPVAVVWGEWTFPIYQGVGTFEHVGHEGALKAGGKSIDCRYASGRHVVRRIGYDLFEEVRHLLTEGQPVAWARTPTLELHIELLRQLLIESNVSFLEIPPRPAGYDFICCLTHDVDFFGIRRHGFDRTMAGFVYRSAIGSLIDLMRGHRSLAEAARNWLALLSLPLVFLKIVPDFWRPFEDYARVENPLQSTCLRIPFKGRSGIAPDGTHNASRASPYGADEIRSEIQQASRYGSELGVHGIDAWCDSCAGAAEMKLFHEITGQKMVGIRMHWLYFDSFSPKRLEEAGFDYDSTWGYNEVVGYRPGTSQVFRPLGNDMLMELPLCIMDSALLSSGRMGLDPQEAMEACRQILVLAKRFGGSLVINWHDRSLAPERQWGVLYKALLKAVEDGGAWFARAGEAVEWFRWRRSIRFHAKECTDVSNIVVSAPCSSSKRAILRICRPALGGTDVRDAVFDGGSPLEVSA